jgi:hypothetical protein
MQDFEVVAVCGRGCNSGEAAELEFEGGQIIFLQEYFGEHQTCSREVLCCQPLDESFGFDLELAQAFLSVWGQGELDLAEFDFEGGRADAEADIAKCLWREDGGELGGIAEEVIGDPEGLGAGVEGKFELVGIWGVAVELDGGVLDFCSGGEEFELVESEVKFGVRRRGRLADEIGNASGCE